MQIDVRNLETETAEWTEDRMRLDQILEAAMIRAVTEQNIRLGIARPASGIGYRAVVAMPVMLSICGRPRQLPPFARQAIWAGAADPWQAIRECWNVGLRGYELQPPEDWRPVTVH